MWLFILWIKNYYFFCNKIIVWEVIFFFLFVNFNFFVVVVFILMLLIDVFNSLLMCLCIFLICGVIFGFWVIIV